MKHLQLQPRLRLLADMVPAGAHLADIGTDHGYLPVWLMQQGRIASAIAADIGPEPLAHARRTAAEYGAAASGASLPMRPTPWSWPVWAAKRSYRS